MREIRLSGSEGGGPKPIASPYPYLTRMDHSSLGDRRVVSLLQGQGLTFVFHSPRMATKGKVTATMENIADVMVPEWIKEIAEEDAREEREFE